MLGGAARRLAVIAISASIAGFAAAIAGAGTAPPPDQASFSVPTLFPDYEPQTRDYVVRCDDGPVTVQAHASDPWQVAVDDGAPRGGDFSADVPLSAGAEFTVAIQDPGDPQSNSYHVRCLPTDFPTFTFTRSGSVSPQFFTADSAYTPVQARRYAIIFDANGVPLWWYPGEQRAVGPRVLANGNILWFRSSGQSSRYEIHRPDGSLVRSLHTVGRAPVDSHDAQLLVNGDYLIGAHVKQSHVDTSAYGGSSDSEVGNATLQEIGADGRLVWEWRSQDHISLDETGRWWPYALDHREQYGYDVVHWNSFEPDGNSVIASFRHLDAIYEIDKTTGQIAWKLGGTPTPESLLVRRDPNRFTLGGQHDARLLPDGTLSAFDNRTGLADPRPRMVRYRIDQEAGTATLLQTIGDPDVPASYCCGSARRMANGDWLIDWGQGTEGPERTGAIGGYRPDGQRTFLLSFESSFSYRAQPVPAGALTRQELRQGMTAMCAPGC